MFHFVKTKRQKIIYCEDQENLIDCKTRLVFGENLILLGFPFVETIKNRWSLPLQSFISIMISRNPTSHFLGNGVFNKFPFNVTWSIDLPCQSPSGSLDNQAQSQIEKARQNDNLLFKSIFLAIVNNLCCIERSICSASM